jgi:hypothetical protein
MEITTPKPQKLIQNLPTGMHRTHMSSVSDSLAWKLWELRGRAARNMRPCWRAW